MTAEKVSTQAQQALTPPPGGWTVDHLDAWPESHIRYELTDGALTVSPSPSSLHQFIAAALVMALDHRATDDLAVTQAVDIRFGRQLTRVPDVLVVRSDEPERHWFAPGEVLLAIEIESPGSHIEDRATKPALFAQFGIPHFWRIETKPARITAYHLTGEEYRREPAATRVIADEPFPIDLDVATVLPRWAR